MFHNIREYGLDITRSAFTGGESVVDYLEAYDVDLFLTTNTKDVGVYVDEIFSLGTRFQVPPSCSCPT